MSTYAANTADAEPPREQPLYGATMTQAIRRFFTKYADFTGRASRSEYWWVYLAITIVSTVVALIMVIVVGIAAASAGLAGMEDPESVGFVGTGALGVAAVFYVLFGLGGLAILIPAIAVTARRLHDAGFSGWWILLHLAPGGSIAVLVFTILPSVPEGARFDNPPYGYPPAPNAPYLVTPYGYPGQQAPYPPAPPANPSAGGWPAPPSPPPADPTANPPRDT